VASALRGFAQTNFYEGKQIRLINGPAAAAVMTYTRDLSGRVVRTASFCPRNMP